MMLKILERYIARTISLSTGMVALVMTAVMFMLTLLAEMRNVGEGDYDLVHAVVYTFYRLPNEIYQFSPMLILLGCLVGLSTLSSHRELNVMRTSGFSTRQIITSVLTIAFILVILISVIGECIAPNLSYRAEIRKENAQNAGEAVVTAAGVWFHVDRNFIHVQHIVGRQLLENVTRYQFDNQKHLEAAYFAKTLSLDNNQWQMHNVVKTSFYHERTKSESFPVLAWNLKFNPNLLNLGLYDPNEMTLPKLSKFSHYLKKNGLQSSEYEYQFWLRIFQPIASLIMVLLAVPFVLGTSKFEGKGIRLIMGIMIGFLFYICNAILSQVSIVYQVSAIFAALLPLVIFGCIGIWLSRKMVRW